MDRITDPKQFERVLCFHATTGKEIWSYRYLSKYKVGYPAGPRASVTIDGKYAYSLGTMGHFYCFDAETGDVIWNKDLKAEYAIKIPTWGIACSPLVEDDRVIIQAAGKEGGCVMAFDKQTGQEIWRALNDSVNYSSPISINQAGKRVVVVWTTDRVAGLDPKTGQVLWQQPFSAEMGIVTPVLYKNYIFVSSFFDGSLLLKLKDQEMGVDVVWQRKGENEKNTDSLHCCISTPVVLDDYIYGVDSYGEFRCLELLTGNRVWENHEAVKHNRWANIYMVQHNDKTWMFNEAGELIISKLLSDGYHEISRTKIINPTGDELAQRGGVCWSHPAFAYKNVYVRNDEELVCLSLADNGRFKPKSKQTLLIDDFTKDNGLSALSTTWRGFTDQVMGGISTGSHNFEVLHEKRCIRLKGRVSLENNGGFVMISLGTSNGQQPLNASAYKGLRMVVRGNGEDYYVHLKTNQTPGHAQYYETSFRAPDKWQLIEIPFDSFRGKNVDETINISQIWRIGIVGAWREFEADVAVSRIELY
jgi:outer membrane protein assembly factor BamB